MAEPHRSALDAQTRQPTWAAPRVMTHVAAINAGYTGQRESMKRALLDGTLDLYDLTQSVAELAAKHVRETWIAQARTLKYTSFACLDGLKACAANWRETLVLDDVRDAHAQCVPALHKATLAQLDVFISFTNAACKLAAPTESLSELAKQAQERMVLLACAAQQLAHMQARAYADLLVMANAARAAAPRKRPRSRSASPVAEQPAAKRVFSEAACQTDAQSSAWAASREPSPAPAPSPRAASPPPVLTAKPPAELSASADPAEDECEKPALHPRGEPQPRKSTRRHRAPQVYVDTA